VKVTAQESGLFITSIELNPLRLSETYRDGNFIIPPLPILVHEIQADDNASKTGYHRYVARNLARGSRVYMFTIVDRWYSQKCHIRVQQNRRLHSVRIMAPNRF
jgi:hypothetical protein